MKISLTTIEGSSAPIRLLAFAIPLILIWLILPLPVRIFFDDTNYTRTITLLIRFISFLAAFQIWGMSVYRDRHIFKTCGIYFDRRSGLELLQGASWGICSMISMFILQGLLGFVSWQFPSPDLIRIVIEGLAVALGMGFAEELIFRGWILCELERNYHSTTALLVCSTIFAMSHFVKELGAIAQNLPQFPGLLLLGMILVWMKRSSGKLALPIGMHAGLIWGYHIFKAGKLIQYTGRVDDWVTGIKGNSLSGIIGIIFLGAIAMYWQRKNRHRVNHCHLS